MKIYNSIVNWIIKKRIHQIKLFINHPDEVQEELRLSLIDKAKNTDFGRTYDFNSIKNQKDFSERIPLQQYEDLEPYIYRMRSGEQNVLWPSKIKWFAKSSGTTSNKSKFIPVSNAAIEDCHYKGGKDLLSIYCNNYPAKNIFKGKSLMLGGSHQMSPLSDRMFEGDLSAIIVENLPFWVQLQRSPDKDIALMGEWEKKLDLMAEQAINEDITSLSGVPSWALVYANKVLDITGKSNLHEVWPNLELYMHGGVNFEPFKKQFKTLIPTNKMNYLEAYNASEGFFGIQDQKDSKDLLLMLDYGIFYEFIPLSEYDNGKREAITLDRIKIGVVYVLIISTNAGLWRYVIGDTIRFTSDNPFRIKIVGRTKSFLNSVGEELMVENTVEALKNCFKSDNCSIKDYIVTSVHDDNGKVFHHWIIEFVKEPKNKDNFMSCLDKNLRLINSDYDAKRSKNLLLQNPQLTIANKDLFYKWLQKNNRLGGQFKIPRLDSTSKIFNDIIKMNITY